MGGRPRTSRQSHLGRGPSSTSASLRFEPVFSGAMFSSFERRGFEFDLVVTKIGFLLFEVLLAPMSSISSTWMSSVFGGAAGSSSSTSVDGRSRRLNMSSMRRWRHVLLRSASFL